MIIRVGPERKREKIDGRSREIGGCQRDLLSSHRFWCTRRCPAEAWVRVEEERVGQEVNSLTACRWGHCRLVPSSGSRNGLGIVCVPPYSRNHEHLFPSFLRLKNVFVVACPCPLQRYILFSVYLFLVWTHPVTGLHTSARRSALTKMTMPAMSPTMVEGGISQWKKAEGETFSSGDVLLEIVCALSSRSCASTRQHNITGNRQSGH